MASKNSKFHGSVINLLTAFAGSDAITAITKASEAVVTSTAHGLQDGDVVRIAGVVGMTDLNGGTYIVEVLTVDTFKLVGVDSTGYGTYVSGGTVATGTWSGNFCELTNWTRTGTAAPTIDTTSLCSTFQENERGLPGYGTLELAYKLAPNTSIQSALNALEKSGEITAFRRILPNGAGETIALGYVTVTSDTAGNGTIWTGTASVQLTGSPYDVELV